MVYYNPYITGQYNPLYTLTYQGFFIAHLGSGQHSAIAYKPWVARRVFFSSDGGTPGWLFYIGDEKLSSDIRDYIS